jgi:glutathione S-transferase
MILHDLAAGMHPRRVRIFLAEKGVSIERREMDAAGGANATPEFIRLNPLGKLPVLELAASLRRCILIRLSWAARHVK